MKTIAFEQVSKSYEAVDACRQITFELREGEIFGLLGPNGAGKTTLIRILLDILKADGGRILMDGEPFRRTDLDRVGYLPEERGLYRKQKVLDLLVYFAMLKGLPRGDARSAALAQLDRVGLAEVAGKKVDELSKGMQQKVQIVGTLLHDPELLVLDEPFSGLDPVNTRLIKDMIRERRSAGRVIILSTHQMAQVEALCDRVALIDRGALVLYGELQRIREHYSDRSVALVPEGDAATLDTALGAMEIVQHVGRDEENGGLRKVLLKEGVAPAALMAGLVESGVSVSRFERSLAPLEDVFVRVVQGDA